MWTIFGGWTPSYDWSLCSRLGEPRQAALTACAGRDSCRRSAKRAGSTAAHDCLGAAAVDVVGSSFLAFAAYGCIVVMRDVARRQEQAAAAR